MSCSSDYLIAYSNRLGAFPIIGTIVGALRTTIALVMSVVGFIFALIKLSRDEEPENPFYLFRLSGMQLGLGIAELIPLLGTIVHVSLHNRYRYTQYDLGIDRFFTFTIPDPDAF